MAVSFIGEGDRSIRRKTPTCRKSLTNFITYKCCIECTSPWTWFELTTLVVIVTDCTGSCKSNYHTIKTTTLPISRPGAPWNWGHFNLTIVIKYITSLSSLEPPWSWLCGSWIYNYLCNQCLSPLTLWVQILVRRCVLDTTLCDKVCQVTWDRLVVFSGYLWFPPPITLTSTI